MNSSDQIIALLVRIFLESFGLIVLGGLFVLGEVFLGTAKGEQEAAPLLPQLRPVFRVAALFFFVLAAVVATDALDFFFPCQNALKHTLLLLGLICFLMLGIILFGVVLAHALAKSPAASWLSVPVLKLAQAIILVMHPLVVAMEFLTTQFLKLFGLSLHHVTPTSDEEVIHMMDEGLSSGVFNATEKEMVERVLDLDEETTASLMTPHSQFVSLNLDASDEENWRCIAQSGHAEFPVFQGTPHYFVGIISVKSLWANLSLTGSVKLRDVMVTPLYVPSTMIASQLIEEFRSKKRHTALVVDEFGVVEGIVTLKDIFETIIGLLPERDVKQYYPKLLQQADGAWLIDAMFDFEEANMALGLPISEEEKKENRYQTIGGFFLHHLGHIPHEGEFLIWESFCFEVMAMHRHRIEQLRVTKKVSSAAGHL